MQETGPSAVLAGYRPATERLQLRLQLQLQKACVVTSVLADVRRRRLTVRGCQVCEGFPPPGLWCRVSPNATRDSCAVHADADAGARPDLPRVGRWSSWSSPDLADDREHRPRCVPAVAPLAPAAHRSASSREGHRDDRDAAEEFLAVRVRADGDGTVGGHDAHLAVFQPPPEIHTPAALAPWTTSARA